VSSNATRNWRRADLNDWLISPHRGRSYIYHRGELAACAKLDPHLAAVAAKVRLVSTGEFDRVSRCGHIRGHDSGSGAVEVLCRREHGVQVHMCRRR
jgi:hypothetical protein